MHVVSGGSGLTAAVVLLVLLIIIRTSHVLLICFELPLLTLIIPLLLSIVISFCWATPLIPRQQLKMANVGTMLHHRMLLLSVVTIDVAAIPIAICSTSRLILLPLRLIKLVIL